jgi:ABC-type branched-subunit amino acid transport system ATPase component
VSALLYVVTTSDVGGSSQAEIELLLSGLLLVAFVLLFRDGLVAGVRRAVTAVAGLVQGDRQLDVDDVTAGPVEPAGAIGAGPDGVIGLPPVVTIRGLSKRFGALTAVDDVDIELVPGTVTALVGPNGAGKSTIVNLVSGVLVPTKGEVTVAGRSVYGRHAEEIARLGLARTFQTPKTFGAMSAIDSVMVGRDRFAESGVVAAALALPAGHRDDVVARDQAQRCLDQVGLGRVADLPMSALPAGHQRLVDVARAMALEPYAVLLDEPAAGLDDTETADLGRIIRRMARAGMAVLLVEHDMRLVMDVADRVAVLEQGRKIADGPPSEIVADQRVIDAYLGVVPA